MGREWRRDAAVLGAAVAAHAIAVGVVAARKLPAVSVENTAPKPAETDVEVTEGEEGAGTEPTGPPDSPLRGFARPRDGHVGEAATPPAARPPSSVRSKRDPAPAESASSAPVQEGIPPLAMVSSDVLGIGSRNPFLTAVPEASTSAASPSGEAPPPDNVAPGAQQALRDGLQAHDHDVGLDIGGPVVALAEDIARTSTAPLKSSAHFEVIADASGNVTCVALTEATDGWDGWKDVATALAQALRTRPLHVPSSTRGVAMTLEVTSDVLLPSGFDPGVDVTVLNIPFKKAPPDQKRPRRVEVLKIDPKIEQVPADPSLNSALKVPQYRATFGSILSFAFDPSDIGAKPQRVVHAHVVRERTL